MRKAETAGQNQESKRVLEIHRIAGVGIDEVGQKEHSKSELWESFRNTWDWAVAMQWEYLEKEQEKVFTGGA